MAELLRRWRREWAHIKWHIREAIEENRQDRVWERLREDFVPDERTRTLLGGHMRAAFPPVGPPPETLEPVIKLGEPNPHEGEWRDLE